jgi:four helix bundle protein
MQSDKEKFKKEFKQRMYTWVLKLVLYIEKLPQGIASSVMGKQLMRSGTSVLANYVEASAASSKKDFTNYFTHALKSANESKVWLALLRDTGKGSKQEVEWLLGEVTEIANMLAGSILTLKGKRYF